MTYGIVREAQTAVSAPAATPTVVLPEAIAPKPHWSAAHTFGRLNRFAGRVRQIALARYAGACGVFRESALLVPHYALDWADVRGQTAGQARLGSCGGRRSQCVDGRAAGYGKIHVGCAFAGILPPMSDQEAMESATVLSSVGQFQPQMWRVPPLSLAASYRVGSGFGWRWFDAEAG